MPDVRLIDANALNKTIQSIHCKDCKNYNGVMCRACTWMDAMDYIEDAQTIEVHPVKYGTWKVEWRKEDYHEMDSGVYAWQYSKSVVHVTCSCCRADIDSFDWDKSGKGAGGLREIAYKSQFDRIDSMKKPFCPNCGADMRGNE